MSLSLPREVLHPWTQVIPNCGHTCFRLGSSKVSAVYFIGGVDEFDGGSQYHSLQDCLLNTGAQRVKGTEITVELLLDEYAQ